MSKYDFSKIGTEDLEKDIRTYLQGGHGCDVISCPECPFKGLTICDDEDKIHELFKEELARRKEMKNNKMPELEAGLIVKSDTGHCYLILIENTKPHFYTHVLNERVDMKIEKIVAIYKKGAVLNYGVTLRDKRLDGCTLIWEKESPKDKKIKEIKNTIKELNKQIEDLENE